MTRFFGYAPDPEPGGTTADVLAGDPIDVPTEIVPVTTSNAVPGTRTLDRDNDVTGRRGNSAPISFAAAPSMTFGSRAWTKLMRTMLRNVMGGSIASVGVAPAAIQSTVQMLQEGELPVIMPTLVREGQVDQQTGAIVSQLEANFPADEEGSIEVTLQSLYHETNLVGDVAGLPAPAGRAAGYRDAYMLRDIVALTGDGVGTEVDCLGGFGFSIDNNMSDELRVTHCAGRNIVETILDGDRHPLWWKDRHKLGAQAVTGRLDFGDTRPDRELRRILAHTEKLVVELSGPPLTPATTPPADEMIRLVFWNIGYTGGGAEALQREGDQMSSYEFTAYIDDATGKDLEAVFAGIAALV